MEKRVGLSGLQLKFLASAAMLLDHLWHSGAVNGPGTGWLTCAGRIAFPVYAFLAAEGYRKTSDRRRYLFRLLFFGLVSEIPFDLCFYRTAFFPGHQNVMWTLAAGIAVLRCLDLAQEKEKDEWRLAAVLLLLLSDLLAFDYGMLGVLNVCLFRSALEGRTGTAGMLAGQACIHCLLYPCLSAAGELSPYVQCFAMAGVLLTLLYDGRRGKGGKAAQLAGYLFYPAHLLVLWLCAAG